MDEGGFAHHPRRRGNASREAPPNLIKLRVCCFKKLRRGPFACIHLWFVLFEPLDNGTDCVFVRGRATPVAARELVWIDVADQPPQRLEMFASGGGLIIVFKKGYSHESVNSKS